LNIVDPAMIIAQVVILFLGIGLHEYAHCKFADMAGDPTPRYYGRVTLNLTKHFEPVGTLMIVLSSLAGNGIGWGRAAPADPRKMRNPRWDFFTSVAAGPVSNLVQAGIYGVLLRLAVGSSVFDQLPNNLSGNFFRALLPMGVFINLRLFLFNLIPFGPLDGHWLVGLLLPEKQRIKWFRLNSQIGMAGVFIAVILLQYENIPVLVGTTAMIFKLLTGHDIYEFTG
jgi:Zn-dependent protease